MSQTILLRQLEAHLQEEIGAQNRVLTLLGAQAQALAAGEPREIAEATLRVERELKTQPQRARRRDELLKALAKSWGLAIGSLTLASVTERAGDDGERLRRQRAELREILGKVARTSRRNTFTARAHERLNADLLQSVLAIQTSVPIESGGALVDAEA